MTDQNVPKRSSTLPTTDQLISRLKQIIKWPTVVVDNTSKNNWVNRTWDPEKR